MFPELKEIWRSADRLAKARDDEERAEAASDLDQIGRSGVAAAICVALVRIQLQFPVVIPLLVILLCLKVWSLFA